MGTGRAMRNKRVRMPYLLYAHPAAGRAGQSRVYSKLRPLYQDYLLGEWYARVGSCPLSGDVGVWVQLHGQNNKTANTTARLGPGCKGWAA